MDIWRIFRQLCGPKPPTNILASLIPDSPAVPDLSRTTGEDFAIQQAAKQRRILNSMLMLAMAYQRQDIVPAIRRALAALPRTTAQRRSRTRPQVSSRQWPAAA